MHAYPSVLLLSSLRPLESQNMSEKPLARSLRILLHLLDMYPRDKTLTPNYP